MPLGPLPRFPSPLPLPPRSTQDLRLVPAGTSPPTHLPTSLLTLFPLS